ncbi:MAG: Ig-like domain repeat protein [Myxococcota bacterium]
MKTSRVTSLVLLAMAVSSEARAATHTCQASEGVRCPGRISDGYNADYRGMPRVLSSTMTVTDSCPNPQVEQVSVRVHAVHDNVGDLVIRVRAPSGTTATLLSGHLRDTLPGGCPGDDVEVTFSPGGSAQVPCRATVPAVDGTVSPVTSLGALSGGPRNGTWTLELEDLQQGHHGALVDWSVDLSCGLPEVWLRAFDAEAREGGSDVATVTVFRSGSLAAPLDVPLVVGGSATPGADYTALPARVTLPANADRVALTVTALDDNEAEVPESVDVALGEGLFVPGTPGSATVWIVGLASTTTLTSSANPARLGDSVTFTITVTGAGGTPSGTVDVMDGGNLVDNLPLTNGSVTLTRAMLTPGLHTLTARYQGDTTYGPSTSVPLAQVIDVETSTTLTVTPNPAAAGEVVTLTATVTDPHGVATGQVTFQDGASTLAVVALSGGVASFATSNLAPGAHELTAVHGSPTSAVASTSPPVSLTVNVAATTTTLVAGRTALDEGESLGLVATVSATSGAPTGVVAFKDGEVTLGYGTLSEGGAALTVPGLKPGTHTIHAEYAGTAAYATSSSEPVTVTVNAAPTPSAPSDDGDDGDDGGQGPACGCNASPDLEHTRTAWHGVALLGLALVVSHRRRR